MEMKPGIYYDLPRDEYDAIEAANWSRIRHMLRSAAHYQAELARPHDSPAMAFGRIAHELILENKRNFVVGGPINPKTGRPFGTETKAFAEWAATQTSPVLSEEDAGHLATMLAVLAENATATTILADTSREVTVVWVHAETGTPCKCRIDAAYVTDEEDEDDYVLDYKTCEDASYDVFRWDVKKRLYAAQLAMYADGLATVACGSPLAYIVAQEKSPPYGVASYLLGTAMLDLGRKKYQAALRSYAECVKTGRWPAYPDQVQLFEID
jgi:exodeoxyribonuclease VIII